MTMTASDEGMLIQTALKETSRRSSGCFAPLVPASSRWKSGERRVETAIPFAQIHVGKQVAGRCREGVGSGDHCQLEV